MHNPTTTNTTQIIYAFCRVGIWAIVHNSDDTDYYHSYYRLTATKRTMMAVMVAAAAAAVDEHWSLHGSWRRTVETRNQHLRLYEDRR